MRPWFLVVFLAPLVPAVAAGPSDADCARVEFGPSAYLEGAVEAGATVKIRVVYEVDGGAGWCPGVAEGCTLQDPPALIFEVQNPNPNLVVGFERDSRRSGSSEHPLGTRVRETNMTVLVRESAPAFKRVAIDVKAWECGGPRARNVTYVLPGFRSNLTVVTERVDGGRGWAEWTLLLTSQSNAPITVDVDPSPARERDPGSTWVVPSTQRLASAPPAQSTRISVRGDNLTHADGHHVVFLSHYDGHEPFSGAGRLEVPLPSSVVPRSGIRFEGEAATPSLGLWAAALTMAAVVVSRRTP